ncbi:MAG TPA: hypothetical protein VFH85_02615 [Gammaproteobacteria bacterium]|nr:hypothetical protein [Gammaproteobacteria bacterium]
MRKTVLFLAVALPAFALLQGCATTPAIYDGARYAPPPGYILVPVPQGYSSYSYYYYDPYPYRSTRYYWPFYPGYVWYSHHHRRPKPRPPCRHCGGKGGGAAPAIPHFVPRGKPISPFYRRNSSLPPPPSVRPDTPQPDLRRLPRAGSPKVDVPPAPPVHTAPRAAPTPPSAGSKLQQPPRKRHVISAPPR